jgi:hypothetical protein
MRQRSSETAPVICTEAIRAAMPRNAQRANALY